jgi:SAM-dependent methyltransferase
MDRGFWRHAYEEEPDGVMVGDHILDGELEGLQPGRALDLGCGSGANVLKLARRGWSVVGVDWAENAIELARQSARARGVDAAFLVGDITEWEPPGEFDLVISTYALPGKEMSRRALATAVTALAPGGILIVAEWDRSMSDVWGFGEDDLMTPEQIVDLLPELEVEKAEVRYVEDPFGSSEDARGQVHSANIALVRARRPYSRVEGLCRMTLQRGR